MKTTATRLLRIFVEGLLAALPLAATVGFFWWLAALLVRWLGPESAFGTVLVKLGLGVAGSEMVGYLMGVGLIILGLFGLGLLVEVGLQRGLSKLLEAVLGRIPVVRTVYDFAQKMVGLMQQGDREGVRSMSAVWCHFGGPGGAAVLALLSTPEPVMVAGMPCLAVLVPTAPVPVGGGLLYVPQDWVTPADIGIEALTSIYVSMGVTSPQHLRQAAQAVSAQSPGNEAAVVLPSAADRSRPSS